MIRTRDAALDGFEVDDHYRTALVDLAGGSEAVWKRLPDKTRNQVRRGQKEGFTIERGHAQAGAFFDVFHEHMRDLGSPAHSNYNYFLVKARAAPYIDPRNPKYRMAIAAWQKMPLALTRSIDPRLISGLA